METILHLFITNTCRHICPLCCNKLYVIDKIPVVTVELLKQADTVCLTGGEPLTLSDEALYRLIKNIRWQYPNIKNLYLYTSGAELIWKAPNVEKLIQDNLLNGINIAPKDKDDWDGFLLAVRKTEDIFGNRLKYKPSNRLYIFDEQREYFDNLNLPADNLNIQVLGRKWQQVFNTPENEHFVRLPILF